jgi:hypothetical protein
MGPIPPRRAEGSTRPGRLPTGNLRPQFHFIFDPWIRLTPGLELPAILKEDHAQPAWTAAFTPNPTDDLPAPVLPHSFRPVTSVSPAIFR